MPRITQSKGIIIGIACCAVCLVLGIAIGAIINDIPLITFKPEVGLDTLLSFAGLIGAIIIVPMIINTYFSKRDNKNKMISSDFDASLAILGDISKLYKDLYLEQQPLSEKDMKNIVSSFRTATNHLRSLAGICDKHPGLEQFRVEIYDQYNEETYKDHTETARVGIVIDDQTYLKASKSLEATSARIRNYRYLII